MNLPPRTTADALGEAHWRTAESEPEHHRLELYLCRLLESRRLDVHDRRVFDRPWPLGLDPQLVPWGRRTRNCLERSGLIQDPFRLAQVTYGELFATPQMGAKSILEFAVTTEAAIDQAGSGLKLPSGLLELTRAGSQAPWASLISDEDPRFGDVLSGGSGTLAERLAEIDASGDAATAEGGVALVSVLPEILARVERIEQAPLDVALRDYVSKLGDFNGPRLDALLGRLGLDGQPPRTLQEIATTLGVTRERVRQLQKRLLERVPSHPVFMPALDRALHVVSEAAPDSADEVARRLQQAGISRGPFHPASVLAAAQLCGRSSTFEIERTPKKGERVVTTPMLASASRIILVASRQSDSFGASNVAEVASALDGRDGGAACSEDQAREVIRHYSNAHFLSDDWFWVPNRSYGRNRLYNVTRRILSVASPLDIGTIRDGARRSYRFREVALIPPRSVMKAFFHAHPAFVLDSDDRVRPVEPLDYRTELGKTEQIFVDVLRSSPTGVLDRTSFEEACEARGMNMNTFSVYSTYSPILEHLGTDIWALRGIEVHPAAVDALRQANAARPRERVVEDYGWSRDGVLWVAASLPKRQSSLVIGIPSSIRHYVADRRFEAQGEDGSTAGTIAVNDDGTSWGYGPFLARRGADEGDILVIEFDLTTEEVTLKLGGLRLLEDAQAA